MDSICPHEISITDQFDSGFCNEIANFLACQDLQLAFALFQKPGRRFTKIVVKITRMAHDFMCTRTQILDDTPKSFDVQKTSFGDSIKPVGSRHCVREAELPHDPCAFGKYV